MSNPECNQVEVVNNTAGGLRDEIEAVRNDTLIAVESVLVAVKTLREEVETLRKEVSGLGRMVSHIVHPDKVE